MNGIGDLLVRCIESFPAKYVEYQKNKEAAKGRLRVVMREIKERLQLRQLLKAFLKKSIFNGNEVDYLSALHDDRFHVFWNGDVVDLLGGAFEVVNSIGEQKVLFKYKGFNVGELEMRNDSEKHYREVRFNMLKPKVMDMLLTNIGPRQKYSDNIYVYGAAIKHFKKTPKRR